MVSTYTRRNAILLLLAKRQVEVGVLTRMLEFDEQKHPRDDKGKFSDGSGGQGGDTSLKVVKKASPAATKDQIKQIVEMKKAGKSIKQIQDATGIGPAQASNILAKHANAEKAITELLTTKPDMSQFSGKATMKLDPDSKKWTVKDENGKIIVEKDTKGMAQAHMDIFNNKSFAAKTTDVAAKLAVSTTPKADEAKNAGYVWQEKTKENSPGAKPENIGKYAYFKNGVQVSAPFAQGEHEKAAATINQGKGPNYIPSNYTSPSSTSPSTPWAPVEKGVGKPGSWPIGDNVDRKMGSTTPAKLSELGSEWSASLTAQERHAVESYTGSHYDSINKALRDNPDTVTGTAAKIASAIAKGPTPPPPELVWRGTASDKAHSLVASLQKGDVVKLNGFQSTSIRPETAHSWGSGKVVFEIKPSKGAYVKPVSSHKHEEEYLLPHGANYTVVGTKNVKLGSYSSTVVQLEMHP